MYGNDLISPELGEQIRRNGISHAEVSKLCDTHSSTYMVSLRTEAGARQLINLMTKGYEILEMRGTMCIVGKK